MNNIDNCESMYKIEKQIRENEDEFIYTLIEPFCENVVKKKLSKAELKQILEKGMQKSIPLAKVKQAREEIDNNKNTISMIDSAEFYNNGLDTALAILDKLIAESEG